MKQNTWAKARKILEKTAIKFPSLLLDCIDSAYFAGLEDRLKDIKENTPIIIKKK